jgi:hypothetical protein
MGYNLEMLSRNRRIKKRIMGKILKMFSFFGINFAHLGNAIRGIPFFIKDLRALKRQTKDRSFPLGRYFPCLTERFGSSGNGNSIYFLQDLFVANRVFANNSKVHIDVGSRIDGFVAHVASFRQIQVFDIRPLSNDIQNVKFVQADMMGELPTELCGCCDSLSCLHALEHFGLGRYGDPVCWDGHFRGLNNLTNILKTGGKLYFSVPIGPQRIEFNAHRVFSIQWLLDYFSKNYRLDQFSYIDDGCLHPNVVLTEEEVANNCGCVYGCGIFEMTKVK